MTYLLIFGGCYVVAGALLLVNFKQKNDFAAVQLRANGATQEQIQNFYRTVNTKSTLLLVRAALVFGSVAGAAISGLYWLVH